METLLSSSTDSKVKDVSRLACEMSVTMVERLSANVRRKSKRNVSHQKLINGKRNYKKKISTMPEFRMTLFIIYRFTVFRKKTLLRRKDINTRFPQLSTEKKLSSKDKDRFCFFFVLCFTSNDQEDQSHFQEK